MKLEIDFAKSVPGISKKGALPKSAVDLNNLFRENPHILSDFPEFSSFNM